MTVVSGNTFPVRGKLKELGLRWDAKNKVWSSPLPLTPDRYEVLISINGILIANNASPGENTFYTDNRTYKQRFGRCEDAPCCGCCGPQWGEY